jgi:hypothetical protein
VLADGRARRSRAGGMRHAACGSGAGVRAATSTSTCGRGVGGGECSQGWVSRAAERRQQGRRGERRCGRLKEKKEEKGIFMGSIFRCYFIVFLRTLICASET